MRLSLSAFGAAVTGVARLRKAKTLSDLFT